MNTKARREREKIALREAILSAARMIAADEGWGAVTIRKIAERIEYSPPTIYEYFADKESLLLALVVEGFRQMRQNIERARAENADPEQALRTMITVFWQFAYDHMELHQLLNWLGGVATEPEKKAEKLQELQAIAREVQMALESWSTANHLTPGRTQDQFRILFATMRGLITLALDGEFTDENGKTDAQYVHRLMQDALSAYLHSWRTPRSD